MASSMYAWLFTALALGLGVPMGCSSPGNTFTFVSTDVPGGGNGDGGGGGGDDVAGFDVPTSACPAGHNSRIAGVTLAPNGRDALPGILVYATPDDRAFPPAATGVACQHCTNPPAALAAMASNPDGSFTLTSSGFDNGGTFTVAFESGGFRHVQRHVTVPHCGSVMMPGSQSRLPGVASGDDTIPRIAVAGFRTPPRGGSGVNTNDKFSVVLDAIGITGFDAFDPDRSGAPSAAGPDIITLLQSPSMLGQYQIVAVPCGSMGNFAVASHITPAMVTNLQRWLAAGGRLYASDLAYSVIDKAFPGGINFAMGTPTRGDPADIGVGLPSGMSTNGNVDDPGLAQWLQQVGAIPHGSTTLPIFDLRDPWGAVDSLPDPELMPGPSGRSSAHIWVSGDVSWHEGPSGPHHHPLSVQADYPGPHGDYCGRVVFTSYHVQATSMSGGALAAQERVLEYLFFQLSTCIQTPG